MACMKTLCKSFLVALNFLVLIVSLAILAVSIYLVVEQYKHDVFGEGTNGLWIVWTPFAFSLLLTLIALVGCCITMEDKKCCIMFYGLLQLLFGIVIVLAGAFLVVYVGYMEVISTTAAFDLAPGLGGSQRLLSDYTTGLFESCCGALQPPPVPCSSTTASAPAAQTCFFNVEAYDEGLDVAPSQCQPVVDSLNLCDGGNGSASLKSFQSTLAAYLVDNFRPAGIAFCVFGAILLLAFFGSCYLVCCAPSKKQEAEAKRSGQQSENRNTTGAPMTMA